MARFAKGQSGNPGGGPKGGRGLRKLAPKRTARALATLAEVMEDREALAAARVSAACALLDRGHGRPSQQLEHTGKDGNPITLEELVAPSCADIETIGRERSALALPSMIWVGGQAFFGHLLLAIR